MSVRVQGSASGMEPVTSTSGAACFVSYDGGARNDRVPKAVPSASQNPRQLLKRRIEIVVHYRELVLPLLPRERQLVHRVLQPQRDHVLGIRPAAAQALFQHLEARRHD